MLSCSHCVGYAIGMMCHCERGVAQQRCKAISTLPGDCHAALRAFRNDKSIINGVTNSLSRAMEAAECLATSGIF